MLQTTCYAIEYINLYLYNLIHNPTVVYNKLENATTIMEIFRLLAFDYSHVGNNVASENLDDDISKKTI